MVTTDYADLEIAAPYVAVPEPYLQDFKDCWQVWAAHRAKHAMRRAYYEGKNRLKNIGIAIPDELSGLPIVVGWPRKAVDELAKCSRFVGFATSGDAGDALKRIADDNGLANAYRRMVRSELVNGLAFATVTRGEAGEPAARIRFYSAANAACLWDYRLGRIKCGLTVHDVDSHGVPTRYVLYEPDCLVELTRHDAPYKGYWGYSIQRHAMGRPLMEPLVYNADLDYPLGHSRITRAVMDITDRAVRESLRTELASEFAATPQKYLLGGTKEDIEALTAGKTRWEMYIGSVLMVSKDEDGETPQYGQLPQVSMQPHMDYFEHLAEEFAAETDIPVDALVRSTTYTSADSASADRSALVQIAEDVNDDNGAALAAIARMALAVDAGMTFDEADRGVTCEFRAPERTSRAAQGDWAVKVASILGDVLTGSDEGLSVLMESVGFTDAQRMRVLSGRRQASAIELLNRLTTMQPAQPEQEPQEEPEETEPAEEG